MSATPFVAILGILAAAALVAGKVPSYLAATTPLLRKVADVPMPGRADRFDYQSLDAAGGRLYISHMDDGHVVVFDLKTRKVIANVPGIPGSTGVLAVPALGRTYASASRIGQVMAIDQKTLRVVGHMRAGEFPDGIAFDPINQRLFVSDESGGADIVLDARADRYVATIPLGGGVGNTQFDPTTHLIFATVGDRNQLVSIDPKTDRVTGRTPLPGAAHPHGLYIDAARRLAFVACEGNARLLTVDLRTMRVTAAQPVGDGPDVLAFDPGLRRLYVACESGIVSVFDEKGRALVKRGDPFIAREAHTVCVDPQTHRLYLPLENVDGRPLLRIMSPA